MKQVSMNKLKIQKVPKGKNHFQKLSESLEKNKKIFTKNINFKKKDP